MAVLSLSLLPVLLPYVVAPFLVGLVASAVGIRQQREAEADLIISENPLQIGAAVRMTVLFQTVMFVVYAVNRQFGDAGVIATGAALGLTDTDALTISMARSGGMNLDPAVAARAIAVGILSNTLMIALLALVIGGARFRWLAAAGLAAMAVASAVSLAVF